MGSTDESPSIPTTLPTKDNLSNLASPSLCLSSTAPPDTPSSPISTTSKQSRDHQRVASLKSQVENLQKQLDEVIAKQDDVNSKLKDPTNPEATVKRHIKTLHEFNEIRDIAQGLIGLIAESRGVRVQDVYPEFGLDSSD